MLGPESSLFLICLSVILGDISFRIFLKDFNFQGYHFWFCNPGNFKILDCEECDVRKQGY